LQFDLEYDESYAENGGEYEEDDDACVCPVEFDPTPFCYVLDSTFKGALEGGINTDSEEKADDREHEQGIPWDIQPHKTFLPP